VRHILCHISKFLFFRNLTRNIFEERSPNLPVKNHTAPFANLARISQPYPVPRKAQLLSSAYIIREVKGIFGGLVRNNIFSRQELTPTRYEEDTTKGSPINMPTTKGRIKATSRRGETIIGKPQHLASALLEITTSRSLFPITFRVEIPKSPSKNSTIPLATLARLSQPY